jgi:general secretion pathway protein D
MLSMRKITGGVTTLCVIALCYECAPFMADAYAETVTTQVPVATPPAIPPIAQPGIQPVPAPAAAPTQQPAILNDSNHSLPMDSSANDAALASVFMPPQSINSTGMESSQPNGFKRDINQNDAWTFNFKDAELQNFLEQIALITGDNFIFPTPMTGKVNISSQTPLKKVEILELMQTILRLSGYSMVKTGHITAIQPSDQAKKFKVPVDASGKIAGQQYIARVFPVKYANVADLVQAMSMFISDHGVVKGFNEVNALLVADSADNVQKIQQLLSVIDNSDNQTVDIIHLQQASVGNVMPLLEKLAPREFGATGKQGYSGIRIVADERSNIIIVKGEEGERMHLRKLIETLDKPADGSSLTQVIYLQNADAKEAAELLKDFFKVNPNDPAGSILNIKANLSINALVVRAPRSLMDEIQQVVNQIDIAPVQVLIEAVIVEVTDDVNNSLGLQYAAGDAAVGGSLAAASLDSNGINVANFVKSLGVHADTGLLNEGFTAAIGSRNEFMVLIQALAKTSKANLLSTPNITTLNNMEAKIVVGQNVPFRTGTFSTANTGVSNPFTTIERQDVGITLKVTPQINSENRVKLKVEQEVSSIEPINNSGAADIITDKRTINTTIIANNGSTVVLGGLISNNVVESQSKVPLLGDIPVVGALFQSNSKTTNKRNLLIFLRPTVLRNMQDNQKVNSRKFNGFWEISMNQNPSSKPSIADTATPSINSYYDPAMTSTPITLPWLLEDK